MLAACGKTISLASGPPMKVPPVRQREPGARGSAWVLLQSCNMCRCFIYILVRKSINQSYLEMKTISVFFLPLQYSAFFLSLHFLF